MNDFESVHFQINELMLLTNNSFEDHLQDLELVFMRLTQARLAVNVTSFFDHSTLEHSWD